MRFRDIKGERALDVMCELIEPIASISLDEEAGDLFCRRDLPEGEDQVSFALNRLRRCYPALMGRHRAEIVHIMATIEGVSDAEYVEKLSMATLLNDLSELVTDPWFRSFFVPAPTRSEEKASGSAQENTEAL